jgi:succinyl-CoA synthetase alpha subunit
MAVLECLMEPGHIGIVARSPALVGEVERQLSSNGLGTSKVVYLPAHGVTHLELLKMFEHHRGTEAVLLLGAIDAGEEEACTQWIARHGKKPVIAFIDPAEANPPQAARLSACGVHMSRDVASIGVLTASLVEYPWLPFD